MKPLARLTGRLLGGAFALLQIHAAHAGAVFSDPFDLILSSINVSGNVTATAGRDLSTSGSNSATGNGALTAGRDAVLGNLSIGGNLAIDTGRNLSINGPLVTAATTSLNIGSLLNINGSLTTGTSLDTTVALDGTLAHALINAGTTAQLTTGRALSYTQSSLTSGGAFSLTAGTDATFGVASLVAGTSGTLTAGNSLSFSGSVSVAQQFSALAAINMNFAGALQTGGGASLSAASALSLGSTTVQGNLAATGGSNLTINGPLAVSGNATLQAGQHVAVDAALAVAGNLSITAGLSTEVADVVQAQRLALSTGLLEMLMNSGSHYGAFHVARDAHFGGLSSVIVSFANGFAFTDGLELDLILAGSLSGVTPSLFSIQNLDPNFGYSLAVDDASVRLSLFALPTHGVPEPGAGLLCLTALALAGAVGGKRRPALRP